MVQAGLLKSDYGHFSATFLDQRSRFIVSPVMRDVILNAVKDLFLALHFLSLEFCNAIGYAPFLRGPVNDQIIQA